MRAMPDYSDIEKWMIENATFPYPFMKGLNLSELFYREAVRPIMEESFSDLIYSAALIGSGSEVLGFDTEQSMDHDWGPRLYLFLDPSDFNPYSKVLDETFRKKLPREIRGVPTGTVLINNGPNMLLPVDEGEEINHMITFTTSRVYFSEYLGFDPLSEISVTDWLVTSQQCLRSIATGRVFHDGLGELKPIVDKLQYYPHDLWLYLLANQWNRISQEEGFVGRTGQVNDELGSRIVASRLIRDIMNLCFLMEKTYAPYIKWVGTGFAQLKCSDMLTPLFHQIMDATTWQERQNSLVKVYEFIAEKHNDLGITAPLDTRPSNFRNRPFLVIRGDKFAEAIFETIQDEKIRCLPRYLGSVDQFSDSTDLLSYPQKLKRCRALYE
ncbi:MAG: DUF4037 domain-containing protein [Candidatus Thorarchaeota archaeon]|nr:DUF4037 domain-containing protein [Candidatus Thorarchaeota archaeon]